MTNFRDIANILGNIHNADVMAYLGDVSRPEDDWLFRECKKRRKRKNIILLLTTRGGDPHVAYRISRCLQEAYKAEKPRDASPAVAPTERGKFIILVPSKCKSAGTILALGATEIWMTENAEFGPIDVQLRKPDEVGERTSGLTPIQAMGFLENQSLRMFKRHFSQLRFDQDLLFSTKMATEIATNVAVGLLSPIFSQIDPLRLAEVERSLRISAEYGERLGKENLKDGALERLIGQYPAHGFVIDRRESEEQIFKNINYPPDDTADLIDFFSKVERYYLDTDETFFFFLNDEPPERGDNGAPPFEGAKETVKEPQDE